MKRNGLPSLAGLQAFDAVARHLSFTRAADEIGVTATAISHRIRAIEAELGTRLFRRGHRSVMLTQDGEQVARDLAESFECMRLCVARLQSQRDERVTIAAEEAFAAFWLLPRIAAFRARHPEVAIRVDPLRDSLDFERTGADAAIVFSRSEQCDGVSECLIQTRLVPVCAPALVSSGRLKAAEMAMLPLLHVKGADATSALPGWEEWFKGAGLSTLQSLGGVVLGSFTLALEAARSGLGVVLAPSHLAAGDIASGRLFAPHGFFIPTAYSHLLVYPQEHKTRPTLRKLRAWLLAEARNGT